MNGAGQPSAGEGFPQRLSVALQGRSGAWLAKQVGASASTANGWLRGGNEPVLSNLIRCAEVLGVSVQWLATGEGRPERGGVSESSAAGVSLVFDKDLLALVLKGVARRSGSRAKEGCSEEDLELAVQLYEKIAALGLEEPEARYGALRMALAEIEARRQERAGKT